MLKEFENKYVRFDSENELLDYLGIYYSSHRKHFYNVVSDFMQNVGSYSVENKDDLPKTSFSFDLDLMKYEIGVTSIKIIGGGYEYYYWLLDEFPKEGYRFKLMDYLEKMNFNMLPIYPFEKPFDEMLFVSSYKKIEELEKYSKSCLENKDELIALNK